jgi:hypothetical protein
MIKIIQIMKYCQTGQLEKIKELYNLGYIDIHKNNDYIFRYCCSNGYIKVAKWLISLGGIDIHKNNNDIFRNTCENGHLKVAKWLYSLGGIDIHIDDDDIIKWCCWNGRLKVAKWLYSLGGIDIHVGNDCLFKYSCEKRYLDIAKWLITLQDRYIIINETTFEYSIKKFSSVLMKKLENPDKYISNKNIDDICMICLTEEEYMCKLECKHIYCCSCLNYYLELEKTKCCLCQKEIDETSDKHLIYKKCNL